MLGLGWTEMLVIGVVALIFIGPKDLPVVMGRIGKVMGQIRRMGAEFQREINRSSGLDEVRNLRTSITAPLKQTADEIRKEFNTMTPSGQQQPSGVLKPADPKVESVVSEIHAKAGMTPPAPKAAVPRTNDEIAAEAGFKPSAKPVAEPQQAPVKTGPVKAAKPAPAKSPKPAPAKPAAKATTSKSVAAEPAEVAPPAPKPARSRAKAAVAATESAAEVKPARARTRKKPADSAAEKG